MASGVFIPCLATSTFATGLSQARRAPAESDPTNAIPASCNRFCKEPSSPTAPWRVDQTTSGLVAIR